MEPVSPCRVGSEGNERVLSGGCHPVRPMLHATQHLHPTDAFSSLCFPLPIPSRPPRVRAHRVSFFCPAAFRLGRRRPSSAWPRPVAQFVAGCLSARGAQRVRALGVRWSAPRSGCVRKQARPKGETRRWIWAPSFISWAFWSRRTT